MAFVGGSGRSGSTVLSRTLNGAPGVCAVGEIAYVWDQSADAARRCGCGELIRDCPLWIEVGQVAFGGWDQLDLDEMVAMRRSVERTRLPPLLLWSRPRWALDNKIDRYRAAMTRVYLAVEQVTGCGVVVDSSKSPAAAFLLRGSDELDLKLIHLIRSSYGVCFSWTKHMPRLDRGGQPMHRIAPVKAAMGWNLVNGLVEMLAKLGTASLRVCYEDFVADPWTEVRRILAFLGLADSGVKTLISGQTVELVRDHSVAGNPMRFRVGAETLRVDDEWRRKLPAKTKVAIGIVTAPGLMHYGYSIRGTRKHT